MLTTNIVRAFGVIIIVIITIIIHFRTRVTLSNIFFSNTTALDFRTKDLLPPSRVKHLE